MEACLASSARVRTAGLRGMEVHLTGVPVELYGLEVSLGGREEEIPGLGPLRATTLTPVFPQGCWRASCLRRRPSAARCNGTPATTPRTAAPTHPPNPRRQSRSITTATTPTSITSGRTTTISTTTTSTTTPRPCCRSPQGLAWAAAGSGCACWF